MQANSICGHSQRMLLNAVNPRLPQWLTFICRSSSNGDAAHSFDDNAESGLGKLRYNKRVSFQLDQWLGCSVPDCGVPAYTSLVCSSAFCRWLGTSVSSWLAAPRLVQASEYCA